MLGNKIRTTTIALVASLSFAGASLVPVAARAQIFKPRDPKAHCASLKRNYEGVGPASKSGKEIKAEAKAYGCKWAGGTLYMEAWGTSATTVTVAPIGGMQGSALPGASTSPSYSSPTTSASQLALP